MKAEEVFDYINTWLLERASVTNFMLSSIKDLNKTFRLLAGDLDSYFIISHYFEETKRFNLVEKDIDNLTIIFSMTEGEWENEQ